MKPPLAGKVRSRPGESGLEQWRCVPSLGLGTRSSWVCLPQPSADVATVVSEGGAWSCNLFCFYPTPMLAGLPPEL